MVTWSDSNIHYVELIGQTITILGAVWSFSVKLIKKLDDALSTRITNNVNRGIKETKQYVDLKFEEHESSAFGRIEKVQAIVDKINAGLSTKNV